jgi:hypothetical protein
MQKTGLDYLFFSLKYEHLKFAPYFMHHPLQEKKLPIQTFLSGYLIIFFSFYFFLLLNSPKVICY